jgi:hypothetical protein
MQYSTAQCVAHQLFVQSFTCTNVQVIRHAGEDGDEGSGDKRQICGSVAENADDGLARLGSELYLAKAAQ